MSIIQEFKTFISRGNVADLAVGVIIGAAFGKIVTSLVSDVIMPPIGLMIGGVNSASLKLKIGGTETTPITVNYGNFLQSTFDFLIIATAIFFVMKAVNKLKAELDDPVSVSVKPPPPPPDVALLMEIRDLLKKESS